MKRILFIAAHPDDETLGCGGTILKHKSIGDEIYWLIITKPTINHPYEFTQKFIDDRSALIRYVSKQYGFNGLFSLEFPTQLLHSVDLREMIIEIEKVIDEIQPNFIYTIFKDDVHSDHRIAFNAVYSCTKNFRKSHIEKILMFETLSETEFAPAIPSLSFVPNVYVDITDFFDRKLKIMQLYDTEIMEEPYPRSLSSITALARLRGNRAGVKYAEAFMLLYEKL